MRKIREVLRLTAAGVTGRQVALSVGVARSTVGDCLRRAADAGLSWPLPDGLDEAELERRVYPSAPPRADTPVVPDWSQIHAELPRKGVTLFLLWREYKAQQADGYQYSRFCDLYRAWAGTQDAVLRRVHACRSSRPSRNPRCVRCRHSGMSTQRGRKPRSTSTITSRSSIATTRCRTP